MKVLVVLVNVDEPQTSSVTAYWHNENVMTASVRTSSDVFVIEVSSYLAMAEHCDKQVQS